MLGFDWLRFQAKLELVSVCVMCFFTYLDPGITCSCLSFPFMSTATCVRPDVLERNHQLVSDLSQLCGTLNPDGWTVRYCQSPCPERSASRGVFNTSASSPFCPWCRCHQLEHLVCTLREICVSIQSRRKDVDVPFTCRVGEIMVRQNRSHTAQNYTRRSHN